MDSVFIERKCKMIRPIKYDEKKKIKETAKAPSFPLIRDITKMKTKTGRKGDRFREAIKMLPERRIKTQKLRKILFPLFRRI
jgi:UDP-3-O-acyl-N-acetylglucosamine deacetylase